MQALLDVILPVFVVIGFGYLAVWRGWFSEAGVDGLMKFTQNFAIPCLLFISIARLDLGQVFEWRLLVSFYTGSLSGLSAGPVRRTNDLFAQLGGMPSPSGSAVCSPTRCFWVWPLTESAYGPDALEGNFAIVALHSPFCYGLGITVMEVVRARGAPAHQVTGKVLKAMFSNALIMGIGLGFIVNLTALPLPNVLNDGLDLIARAALPAALFGMGGVLVRYRPEGDLRVVAYVCLVALIVHPMITSSLSLAFDLSVDATRSAVITAAMAPGINSYIFANMYGVGRRVAASSVLIATALSILTVWVWLGLLP